MAKKKILTPFQNTCYLPNCKTCSSEQHYFILKLNIMLSCALSLHLAPFSASQYSPETFRLASKLRLKSDEYLNEQKQDRDKRGSGGSCPCFLGQQIRLIHRSCQSGSKARARISSNIHTPPAARASSVCSVVVCCFRAKNSRAFWKLSSDNLGKRLNEICRENYLD